MTIWFRAATAAALLVLGTATTVQAQSPQVKAPANLALQWLHSLTVSPSTITGGASATATVRLLRPAITRMEIGARLVGGAPTDGGTSLLDGNYVPQTVYIPAGSDRVTFQVYTTAESAPRTLTIEIRYGKEVKSAILSTTRLQTKKPGVP
jgi:hypothetical protein